jgi:tripartite-type tricarboxylate transporter receptor subunit TctC
MRLLARRLFPVVLMLLAVVSFAALAQPYPDRPVTLVVPFAAGGPTDTLARLVADGMSRALGRPVAVENVGGAGGTLGAARVAKAAPDGYTLLLHNISQATSGTLYRDLAYDPVADFAPIGLIADVPMTIVARPAFPAADLAGLAAHLKANPGRVPMGHAGIGVSSHLCAMLLTSAIGAPVISVAYKGTAPALTDLLGGRIDLLCDQTTNTTPHILAGKAKAYGVTTKERVPTLPDLPTTAEGGLPGVEITVWHGLYAPAGTPPAVIETVAAALRDAIAQPAIVERLTGLGAAPVAAEQATPEAHKAHLDAEIAKWEPIIRAAGIYAN